MQGKKFKDTRVSKVLEALVVPLTILICLALLVGLGVFVYSLSVTAFWVVVGIITLISLGIS